MGNVIDDLRRATERHDRLRRRKHARQLLRDLERRLRAGMYDENDWLDDELTPDAQDRRV